MLFLIVPSPHTHQVYGSRHQQFSLLDAEFSERFLESGETAQLLNARLKTKRQRRGPDEALVSPSRGLRSKLRQRGILP